MPYQITMTTRGRITIPKEIRKILKFSAGEKIQIKFERRKREIKLIKP